MTTLQVQHLFKTFHGSNQFAVNDVSFDLSDNEILALVGPSGCGKTTTLRLIAGLERPDAGVIQLGGRILASDAVFIPPEQRGMGMVFQDHALFPHLNVYDNIAFGLLGKPAAEIKKTVDEMLHLVGLLPHARKHPHMLSGGERQRVALARALAPRPILVLMDEPFSSLDADLRIEVREQVREILKSMRATVVFVTHDQDEALYMGDRLAVLNKGRLEQIGAPEEIFHESGTRFVAEFMGDSDFIKGIAQREIIQTEIGVVNQRAGLPDLTPVTIAVRADDVGFQLNERGNGVIAARIFRGAFNQYKLKLDSGGIVHAATDHTRIHPVGARVTIYISAEHPLVVFTDCA